MKRVTDKDSDFLLKLSEQLDEEETNCRKNGQILVGCRFDLRSPPLDSNLARSHIIRSATTVPGMAVVNRSLGPQSWKDLRP